MRVNRGRSTSMSETAPRLLVVDDEPAVLTVVERFAHKLGFEVIFRSSGR